MAESAVRESPRGVLLEVVVTPNARRSEVRGIDPWRNAVQVRVGAKAQGGAANQELVRFMADRLHVPVPSVRILAGHTSRRKTLAVAGLTKEEVLARLQAGGA